MTKQILIAEKLRIAAILNNERVDQFIVAQGQHQIGDIYLGMVENVHPGIDAAFVNIGESERNGFIHVTDLGPLRLRQTAGSITELLEPRQKALVQVMKEPTGSKGPRLTGNITLPGRFLVLQPSGQGVNISRRINEEAERDRLRALAVLIKPPGTGLLVRTKAEGVGEDQIIDDLEMLCRQWETIQSTVETCQPPVLLNRDDDFVHRTLRDHCGPGLDKVVVDSLQVVERVKAFLGPEKNTVAVDSFASAEELLEAFRIHAAIHQALLPRVDLPSGGYVIIEPTEALTVVDVNSGSFTRSATARETVLWTNCEAATEIARQLQLRNIGGMIIVDFIDMESRRDQLLLLEHFMKAMGPDKARPQIAQITELGLVELTRKRQGQNIYELFGGQRPNSGSLGTVATVPGKATMQPLATGTVQAPVTAPTAPVTVPTGPGAANVVDGSNGGSGNRRRRRGGGGRSGASAPVETPATPSATPGEPETSPSPEVESGPSSTNAPETVAIPMNEDQKQVFSWCGFNPALMAPTPPRDSNAVAVRVVSPGGNTQSPLTEAEDPTTAATVVPQPKSDETADNTARTVGGNAAVPQAETPMATRGEAGPTATDNEQDNGRPRRRRRRSAA
ncbi:Rne/Rng family ribonuclease [Candidatus Synechococcus spongiarum]|uniref:Cytoplasmic axial filament protein CafA and Ribonuclease G n=1 Tax=Candidatus Synechococcus spongiarum TaxID=431041 RepID=A0A164Z5J6_9SYNE|nr:Rne/Rng family ribonuclease [Candidatus Synechococcus spongiarum]SAY39060.1 Cytoplasmic axial filament protein CafA and Ribonuclease G (EC 3.1.4.-) [Candidatus Synechococcus spongiarum]